LLFLLILPVSIIAATNIVSRPVGFIRISIPENDKSLISIPFKPFDPSIESVLSGQLTGSGAEDTADTVIKWNPSSLKYEFAFKTADGKWLSDFSKIVPSEMTLKPGEGFFIWNRQAATQDIFLAGEVVLDASNTVVLLPPLNIIGSPYSASITNSSLPGVGSNTLVMSKGYWYNSAFTGATVWVEVRPYADEFPAEGELPAITGITVTNGAVVLAISGTGADGEKYEIYYQDYSATNQFNSLGWQIAQTNILANGRTTLEWTDTSITTGLTAHDSSIPSARYYLVGRSDILGDDGLPLCRSKFVPGTSLGLLPFLPPPAAVSNSLNASLPISGPGGASTRSNLVSVAARAVSPVTARIIFVDRKTGADLLTGRAPVVVGSDGPKQTIQSGLNAVKSGDSMIIKSGTYNESMDLSGRGVYVRVMGDIFIGHRTTRSSGTNGQAGAYQAPILSTNAVINNK